MREGKKMGKKIGNFNTLQLSTDPDHIADCSNSVHSLLSPESTPDIYAAPGHLNPGG
jgi:hypothetical protein